MNNLEKAIVSTLKYHNEFDYPLELEEIWKLLIINRIPKTKLENLLTQLIKEKKIGKTRDYYYISGRKSIVSIRKKREKYSKEKIKIGKRIIQLFKFIPWIKMVGITGALAMNNTNKDDDIDLLIITSSNRLWFTRLCLIIILEILGNRRRPKDKDIKDKICLNMFLDETALGLVKNRHNLFTSHEIVQMKPVFNKDNTYEKFLGTNLWVKEFLPNGIGPPACGSGHFTRLIQSCSMPDPSAGKQKSYILNLFNNLAYKMQYKFMKSKITTEQISPHYAFFHPLNRIKNE